MFYVKSSLLKGQRGWPLKYSNYWKWYFKSNELKMNYRRFLFRLQPSITFNLFISALDSFSLLTQTLTFYGLFLYLYRGHAILHLAVSVSMSVCRYIRQSHFWISSCFRITAPAQPSTTGLTCIQPCWISSCFRIGAPAQPSATGLPCIRPCFLSFFLSFFLSLFPLSFNVFFAFPSA